MSAEREPIVGVWGELHDIGRMLYVAVEDNKQ